MADLGTSDAAVSNVQVDADSLEFTVNTNLSAVGASPKDASPSLQELIEAELNARLCQPDSLEPPASPNPSSLLSCDSIEATAPTLIPAPAPTIAPAPVTKAGLSLDSLLELDSLHDPNDPLDPLATADTESGIDVLSPTKLDDLSNVDMDSLESSSDLPASSHSSPEPTTTTLTQGDSPTAQNTDKDDHLLIIHSEESFSKTSTTMQAEALLLATREDSDAASLGAAQPLLRISESSLTIASETRSELSHLSQEVTRSSTPDSLTSLEAGAPLQDTATPQDTAMLLDTGSLLDTDPPQNIAQDSALLESILLQNSTPLQTTEDKAGLMDSPLVPDSVLGESQGQITIQQSQESAVTQDSVSSLIDMTPQEGESLLDAPLQQHTDGVADGGVAASDNLVTTDTDLLQSLGPSEVTADPSPPTLPAEPASPSSPTTPSFPQGQDDSPLDPAPQGVLPPSGTNSVCGGDPPNAARDDCGGAGGVGVVSSGGVDAAAAATTTACSSGVGVGGGVSGPVPSPLQNGANMEPQMDEDEDDFWGGRNDDDDFVPRSRPDPVFDQQENDTQAKEDAEEAQDMMEEEQEEEGHILGSDGDDAVDTSKGAKGLRFKKRTTTTTTTTTTRTENGVGKVEKKEKKEIVEETDKAKTKKIEESVEKKKIEVKEDVGKAKKKEVEEEEKENGVEEDVSEKKKKKKHRDTEDGERRKKKKKKRDSEKENKKAAYQKRDDILEKHVGPRVRSFDAAKMKSKFEKPKQVSQVSSECRQCGKQVFQMEKIVAEKAAWHKNCFRCKECNCILNLETYQSHEGVLYCKPHFKELFRPKAVVEDPDEARKERSTNKPDYGLDDLSTADLKQKFKMFEQIATEEERTPEPIPVRRSQSLLSKAARFMQGDDEYGIENSELGEYEDYDEDEEEEEEEEDEEGEEGEEGDGETPKKKKSRPTSFSGMKDLKAGFARKNRQDELTKKRRQELAKFRQMLCAGKNISTREIFEGGSEDGEGKLLRKEQIKIDGHPDARNLRERFEKGLSITEDDLEDSADRREVDRVFKEAETASKARNLFKQIDKTVAEGGEPVMRPHTSAQARRENRLSRDGKRIRNFTSQVFEDESDEEDEEDEKSSLADRFKFFATYEERAKDEGDKRRKKLFRFTPPRDGEDQGIEVEELELGRDPNLVKCTDNYEDAVDCRGTRKLLAKFRKMEMQAEDMDGGKGLRPPKQFTPPPEGEEEYDSDEEYSDEEYSDEDEEDSEEGSEEDSEGERKPKYKDEVLEMVKSSQSAKKAASLRAKFEKWEEEVERNNEYNQSIDRYEDEEECMPSIDTARNLRAMFENKAQEATRPATERPKAKVNRFVGGGGDKCMLCARTVYAMERLEVAGRVLHKTCFKCCKCSTKLSMNTFSIGGDDMYCTTHYKQAFTEKGTYDVFTPNKGSAVKTP